MLWYSGRDFSLQSGSGKSPHKTELVCTDLANERDAVLAMTVLERFEIAVVTSISACASGGMRRESLSPLGGVESHTGTWRR